MSGMTSTEAVVETSTREAVQLCVTAVAAIVDWRLNHLIDKSYRR